MNARQDDETTANVFAVTMRYRHKCSGQDVGKCARRFDDGDTDTIDLGDKPRWMVWDEINEDID